MPTSDMGLDKTLAALGVAQPDQVAPLFGKIQEHFAAHFGLVHDESDWKIFRDRWLGRKSGVLAQVTDNWLKPAPHELKRSVVAALNELRAQVQATEDARRLPGEAGADETSLTPAP